MPAPAEESPRGEEEGIAHRVAQRDANKHKSSTTKASTDAHNLIEFACECTNTDCERTVRVPLDVYSRMVEADHYLLQAGHHAFTNYRTVISLGHMRVEERA